VQDDVKVLTGTIIGGAIAVHRELGPGLLESTYEACLAHELERRGLGLQRQKGLPIRYKGIALDCGYRLDFVVENKVILELKAVKTLEAIDSAQMLSYLRLSGYPLGLLINFNVPVLVHGLKRYINKRGEHGEFDVSERPEDRWLQDNKPIPKCESHSVALSVDFPSPSALYPKAT